MRESKYTKQEKVQILREKENSDMTIKQVCDKHGISISTYYVWQREINSEENKKLDLNSSQDPKSELESENTNLKMLYISLSEHNYELSKLLIK